MNVKEENVDPLPSILKFFNTVIHIPPKCLVRFLTIELLSAACCFFHFIEHFYGMLKVFTERLVSYIQSIILKTESFTHSFHNVPTLYS